MCRLIRRVESIKYKTRIPKVISTVLSVVCTAILITGITISDSLPALFKVSKKGEFTLYSQIPISAETENTSDSVFKNTGNDLRSASLKLFGTIPIKDVTLNYVDTAYVVVSGESFGIKIFTDGVMIVGMTGVETADGTKNPAEDAGLKAGDIILAIDNKTVSSNSELSAIIRENGGKT